MTGSITGPAQQGLVQSFRPAVMVGEGNPDNVVLATSGTVLRDFVNDKWYVNNSGGAGAGSEWVNFTAA